MPNDIMKPVHVKLYLRLDPFFWPTQIFFFVIVPKGIPFDK
jgi:hypothetical protein